MPPLIAVQQVSRLFTTATRTVTALDNISFDIHPGNFVSIVGPSGCGKSTLLKIISGLMPASSGTVTVAGHQVDSPLENVGMVFQAPVLLKWRSVLGNVLLPVEFAKLDMPAKKNVHAITGVTLWRPPKSEIFDDPRRDIIHPPTIKSAAVEKP